MPDNANEIEKVELYGEEPQGDENLIKFVSENVTDRDIFKLAKSILLCCLGIFIIIAIFRIIYDERKGITDVWEYSKVVLNSITSLVLGLYFGKKDK